MELPEENKKDLRAAHCANRCMNYINNHAPEANFSDISILKAVRNERKTIFDAINAHDKDAVAWSLKTGTDITTYINNGYGDHPILVYAIIKKAPLEIISLLLNADADIEAKNSLGVNALIMATCVNNLAVVKMLVEKGAKINTATWRGYTPLYFAISSIREHRFANVPLIEFLLTEGADPDIKNNDGHSIQDYVSQFLRETSAGHPYRDSFGKMSDREIERHRHSIKKMFKPENIEHLKHLKQEKKRKLAENVKAICSDRCRDFIAAHATDENLNNLAILKSIRPEHAHTNRNTIEYIFPLVKNNPKIANTLNSIKIAQDFRLIKK
jgi:hypothetical protein